MRAPNVLVVLADQMRAPAKVAGDGLPEDLREIFRFAPARDGNAFARWFPALQRLRQNAVILHEHTIASSACTPSRAVLFTGQYATKTGVTQTDGLMKTARDSAIHWLAPAGVPTLGDWFRAAGYSTHWFGKWHLSRPRHGDLEPWGFADGERSAPEPHGANPKNLGIYRDLRFARDAVRFLRARGADAARDAAKPWLAVVSLVNPHDIAGFPAPWWPGVDLRALPLRPPSVPDRTRESLPLSPRTRRGLPLNPEGFPDACFELPETYDEDLRDKPRCHREAAYKVGLAFRARWPRLLRPISPMPFQLSRDPRGWLRAYGRFWTYLHHLMDRHLRAILAALDESGEAERTLVCFTSDHGEHAGAHGGMIHKWHTAYEEIVRVPCVIASPLVNSSAETPRDVHAPTSHVDLVPTLLGLAGFDAHGRAELAAKIAGHRVEPLAGADLTPAIRGHDTAVTEADGSPRDAVYFETSDEISATLDDARSGLSVRRGRGRKLAAQVAWAIARGAPIALGPVAAPCHVACVRTPSWKLVRTFDRAGREPDEWELYALDRDPHETRNLVTWEHGEPRVLRARIDPAWGLTEGDVEATLATLRERLERAQARFA